MKKLFVTSILITAIAANAAAQSLSVGMRTGTSCWMQRAAGSSFKLEALPGQRHSWDNEIFVRREGKGRWAFEGGLAHSALTNSHTDYYIMMLATIPEGYDIKQERKGR